MPEQPPFNDVILQFNDRFQELAARLENKLDVFAGRIDIKLDTVKQSIVPRTEYVLLVDRVDRLHQVVGERGEVFVELMRKLEPFKGQLDIDEKRIDLLEKYVAVRTGIEDYRNWLIALLFGTIISSATAIAGLVYTIIRH